MELSAAYAKYRNQEAKAEIRGVEWKITFQEWLDWWGDDLDQRGPRADQLVMCRFHDKGPYQLGNICKGHPRDNAKTNGNVRRTINAATAKEALNKALNQAETVASKDREWLEDGTYELMKMTGALGGRKFVEDRFRK